MHLVHHVAEGILQYVCILKNPKICSGGRWIGDLSEALNILSGGRSICEVQRGKNLEILRRAKLMFDIVRLKNEERAVLHQQKHHAVFKRACALIAS
jgi:hypothetical protein